MKKLPKDHRPYTDKYFIHTREILQRENINPRVSLKVFSRGQGPVAGLDEAIHIFKAYANIESEGGEIWILNKQEYISKEALMIIKAPAQSVVELETMYLGVISAALTQTEGLRPPDPNQIRRKLQRLKEIYQEIPIIYFGARHYHWSMDKEIAGAALAGGAVQTSTDIGSSNIGLTGVGTTPHFLTIVLASLYGKEEATLRTAMLFDKHMPESIPRVTLVDTFNREITDALAVSNYFGSRPHAFRIDTCGENIGEGTSQRGVTIELVTNLRKRLIEMNYGSSSEIFLSSGFGNEEKAIRFMQAHRKFEQATGFPLFSGVGIGEVSKARFCTSDIFEVNDQPLSKTGREAGHIDWNRMKRVI